MEKERKFVMYTGCKTYGHNKINSTEMRICGDPECTPCISLARAFKAEVDKYISKVEGGITGNVLTDEKFKEYKKPYKAFSREQLKEAIQYVFRQNKTK